MPEVGSTPQHTFQRLSNELFVRKTKPPTEITNTYTITHLKQSIMTDLCLGKLVMAWYMLA